MKKRISTDWRPWPEGTQVPDRLFVIGDVHGQLEACLGMLEMRASCDQLAGENSQLIFLGDLIDRGPESLAVLSSVLDLSQGSEKAVLLPGNHECMLFEALLEENEDGFMFNIWEGCGGHSMVKEAGIFSGLPIQIRRALMRDALPGGFMSWAERAKSHHVSGDLLMVHAGIPPVGSIAPEHHPAALRGEVSVRDFLSQSMIGAPANHWAWIREPFLSWRGGWGSRGRRIVIHGHSPATQRALRDPGQLVQHFDRTSDAMRINLDAGSHGTHQVAGLEIEPERYRIHLAG